VKRSLRIILIVYCLLLVYCCVWIPWHLVDAESHRVLRAGYGWLWTGPSNSVFSSIDALALMTPDFAIIALRIVVATAICGAAYIATRS
jgi:hypothetical protein